MKIKKGLAIMAVVATPIIIYVLIWAFFWGNGIFVTGTELNKSDWLNFLGAYLGFVGTIFLGGVSLYQNEKLHRDNKQLQEQLLTLDYRPIIEVLSYQITEPYTYQGECAINDFCFLSETAKETIVNYDVEKDVYSAFDIKLSICNSNPKVALKQIWFVDYLQVINFEHDIVCDVPCYAIQLIEAANAVYHAELSLVYKKEEWQNDCLENSCEAVLASFAEDPAMLQATLIVENYQGVCEQCHIMFQLLVSDFKEIFLSRADITKDQIEYYPLKYISAHIK